MDNRDYPSNDLGKLLRVSNIDRTHLPWARPVTMTNCAPTASRDCCRGGQTLDGQPERVWAYRWQNSAGEAYESIGIDGNQMAIGISRPDSGACEPSP